MFILLFCVPGGELDGRHEVLDGGRQVPSCIHAAEHSGDEHVLRPQVPGLESKIVPGPELLRRIRTIEALHGPEACDHRLQSAQLRAQQALRRIQPW